MDATYNADGERFRDCYVAYLDILGFRELVAPSDGKPPQSLKTLRELATITASIDSSKTPLKGDRACLMQTRAFSDHMVLFTPCDQDYCDPLAEMLFLVRYVHDQILELGKCVRGGVVRGPMYWHITWDKSPTSAVEPLRRSLPLTFGRGLVDAYVLESQKAIYPRIVISGQVFESAQQVLSHPFARKRGVGNYFRCDRDGVMHLDVLHPDVMRQQGEAPKEDDGLTIEWSSESPSKHPMIMKKCGELIEHYLRVSKDARIRCKYEWLQTYLRAHGRTPQEQSRHERPSNGGKKRQK